MNSVNTGWNDEDFSTIEKDLIKSQGIVDENADGSDLVVEENSPQQMNVLVNSGVAYVHITKNGRDWWVRVANDAQAQVTVAPNVSGSTRIDALVLRVSVSTEPNASATNVATLAMVQGTPGGAAPSDGDINTALGSDGWIRLANITVDNGVGQIFTADIEDTRNGITFGLGNTPAGIIYYGDGSQLTGVVHSPVDGDILPGTADLYDIGAALNRFRDLYLKGGMAAEGWIYSAGDITTDGEFNGDGAGITNINASSMSTAVLFCGETLSAGNVVYKRRGFYAQHDTYVDQANAATNYDTNNSLYAGRYGGASTKRRSLIKLNLADLGASVTSAKLRLYVKTKNGANATLNLHRNTADYTSSSVVYNTMPAYDAAATASASITAVGWYEIDITTIVNQWLAGTYQNYGLTLVYGDELSDNINIEVYSKDDTANYQYIMQFIIDGLAVLFKASASYADERSLTLGVMGEAGTVGQKKRVITGGVLGGFSTTYVPGDLIYLQNTAGTIGSTIGTYEGFIGYALGNGYILIMKRGLEWLGTVSNTVNEGVSNTATVTVTVPAGTRIIFWKTIASSGTGGGVQGQYQPDQGVLTREANNSGANAGAAGSGGEVAGSGGSITWDKTTNVVTATCYAPANHSYNTSDGYLECVCYR